MQDSILKKVDQSSDRNRALGNNKYTAGFLELRVLYKLRALLSGFESFGGLDREEYNNETRIRMRKDCVIPR